MEASTAPVGAFAEVRAVTPSTELAVAVDAAIARARARWPAIAVDPVGFARFLAARVDEAGLADACVEDLLLAAGGLGGDRAALAGFDELLAQVPAWVKRPAGPLVDELTQQLRTTLLVGPQAGLAGYKGRGALHAWLRVSALRLLWKLEAEGRERPVAELAPGDEPAAAGTGRTADPVRALAGMQAEPALALALQQALAALTSKQRALLRLRHAGGVTDEKIGHLYGVHQSTATRWLAAAHDAVATAVRRHLQEQLRLRADEVDSILGVARSRIDLSLSAMLRTGTGRP